MTKPEPVETAEQFVRRNWHRLDSPSLDDTVAEQAARDAALVAEAEARAKVAILDELATQAALCHDNSEFGRPTHAESFCAAHWVLARKYTKGGADGG